MDAEDLARVVTRASGRVSVFGPDKRYLAASVAAAQAYRTMPGRIGGCHLHEVIGCGHSQNRERQRLELAFMGRPQQYQIDGKRAPVTVTMRAVSGQDQIAYAVVHIVGAPVD